MCTKSHRVREKCEAKANIVVLSIKLILNLGLLDLYITFFFSRRRRLFGAIL